MEDDSDLDIKLCAHTLCFKWFEPAEPSCARTQLYCSPACMRQARKWRKSHSNITTEPKPCYTPNKRVRFSDKYEMRAYVIKRNFYVRPYFCVCHMWHVSTVATSRNHNREDVMRMFGVTGK